MTVTDTSGSGALAPPRVEGTVRLSDGRSLGYAEYGPPDGKPVLWFHGTPGARRQIPPSARRAALERGIRLIALERPGVGLSTPHRYRNLVEWAADVEEFVDRLGIDRFGVVGLSGGGPYVLACAHEMPDRVVAAAVLGGVAPAVGDEAPQGGIIALARHVGELVGLVALPVGHALRGAIKLLRPLGHQAIDLYMKLTPPGDQEVFRDPAMREMFLDDIIHAAEHNMHAILSDFTLFGRPWGFSVRDISVPVRFWHGDADNLVPLEHGRHLADLVDDSELRVRPEEGHLGSLDAAEEVLDAIFAEWPDEEDHEQDTEPVEQTGT